jgi:2-polyprenyl-6-methoxyphenol hydroxylase-like FAD-dependent oxidoreductase
MAECLPPSTRKVFRFLGIEDAAAAAGFLVTTGNTVWWGGSRRRVEPYPENSGYQVLRREFDRLLLSLAEQAGAHTLPSGVEQPTARFVLDCSGRAGVLARQYRVRPKHSRTVALCGVWRSDRGWRLPDASHTLVEAYADGWAWSVPLSRTLRHVAFMVDPRETKLTRGKGLATAYTAEFAKTRAFRRIFAHSEMAGAPWGRDASAYTSRQFCGPGFLFAGDAASSIDPLSSFGVKKALVSGWAGAVVANTWLRRPEMRQAALRFHDERERQVYESYQRQAGGYSREVAAGEARPFWGTRSETAEERAAPLAEERVRAVWQALRETPEIRLRRGECVEALPKPRIEDREVVLGTAYAAPGSEPLDFVAGVEIARLVELAPHCRQVPDFFDAYNRSAAPVELPEFVTALSTLVAAGILVGLQ